MARKSSVDDFVIDFSKEEQGSGGGIRVKEGTYAVKIKSAKAITSEEKGTPGLEVVFVFTEGKYAKKSMRDRLWATPKAYSRFRTLLEACGKRVPERVNLVKIASAIPGSELYIEVQDEERKGYPTRSRVTFEGFIHPDDYDPDADDEDDEDDDPDDIDDGDDDEDDDPPARRSKSKSSKPAAAKKSKKKAKDDDEDEDLDDDDDMDLDEL